MEFLTLVSDVGFPIAAAMVGMYFVFLTIKFLLDSVLEKVTALIKIMQQLDKRLTAMSRDILHIDTLLDRVLGLPPEEQKVERLKSTPNERKD